MRIERVGLVIWPWLFRLPWFRRFDGHAAWNLVILRQSVEETGDDLITHELCHVWQMQHRPIRMPLSYPLLGYSTNPYELQARWAAEVTSDLESE